MNGKPKPKKRRDPLLDAADALESGHLTHEQLLAMNTPEAVAQGYQQDTDLGPWLAGGLGAARGASFGLGDLAQKLALSPTERAAVQTTAGQHPYATAGGTIAGAALPLLLTGGQSAAALPGLSVRGSQVALGAAQGFGLTPGSLGERAVGAGIGGATSFAAPYLAKGMGTMVSKLPILGSILKRAGGVQAGFPAALKAAEGTPEEMAVAAKLGIPLSQVRGRVGQAAMAQPRAPVNMEPILPALRAEDAAATPKGLLPYYARGGQLEQMVPPPPVQSPPLIGPASPETIVQQTPYAQLMQALQNPASSPRVRQAVLQELQRRGIVGGGLLAPAL